MKEPRIPTNQLPDIPNKRYFTIGEASKLCGEKTHSLRHWEQEFPALKPQKRRGNRRYYRAEDILLIRRIRSLIHEEGFTTAGARKQLAEEGAIAAQLASSEPLQATITDSDGVVDKEQLIRQLESTLKVLRSS